MLFLCVNKEKERVDKLKVSELTQGVHKLEALGLNFFIAQQADCPNLHSLSAISRGFHVEGMPPPAVPHIITSSSVKVNFSCLPCIALKDFKNRNIS